MRSYFCYIVSMAITVVPVVTGAELQVIYGDDDIERVVDASAAQQRVAESTVALVFETHLFASTATPGAWDLRSSTVGERHDLCHVPNISCQPSAAECSGFFVGDDLFVTAGHCISLDKGQSCRGFAFVFGFTITSSGADPTRAIPGDDVYFCDKVIDVGGRACDEADWILVAVDRKVQGRVALALRDVGTVTLGDALTAFGHPLGMPTSVSDGATVQGNDQGPYFEADLDTFVRSSGSPVFLDSSIAKGAPMVEGLVSCGHLPNLIPSPRGCYERVFCDPHDTCDWQRVTRASEFATAVKAALPP